MVMIGSSTSSLRKWPRDKKASFKAMVDPQEMLSDRAFGKAYKLKDVLAAVTRRLPPLRQLSDEKLDWGLLQYLESQVIVASVLRCSRELGAPALSVHDSIIVPSAVAAEAEVILKEEFLRIIGVEPRTVLKAGA